MIQYKRDWITSPKRDSLNFYEEHDIVYWTNKWKVTEAQLMEGFDFANSALVRKIYQALCKLGYLKPDEVILIEKT